MNNEFYSGMDYAKQQESIGWILQSYCVDEGFACCVAKECLDSGVFPTQEFYDEPDFIRGFVDYFKKVKLDG